MDDVEFAARELAISRSVEEGVDTEGHRCLMDVMACAGEIDLVSEPEFREGLARLTTHDVVVDLSGVTFIGAAGINALIEVAEQRHHCGTVRLRDAPAILCRVLHGLDLPANLIRNDPPSR